MTDIRAFPDTTGYAPRSEAWYAIDCGAYDYAPDAKPHPVGVGPTPQAAMAELLEQIGECGR